MTKVKKVLKTIIIMFSVLRLFQAVKHMIMVYIFNSKMFFLYTALSITVAICSLILLIGTFGESLLFLEVWMVWMVLKFGAVVFGVFDLNFERDSFIPNQVLINTIISSILQLLVLIAVLKLHKVISISDDSEYYYDSEDIKPTTPNVLTIENQEAVAFEPCLFSNLMLYH